MNALLRAWDRTLRRCGDARAVVEAATGAAGSFRELDARATGWLAALDPATRASLARRAVVFAVPNGLRWLELFLGLQRAGAIAVPMDPGEPPAAQRAVAAALRAAFWWDGERLVRLGAQRIRHREAAAIKLTSGTTGQPRPLIVTASQMLADARNVTGTMGITARDVNYALIPLGHSYGLGNVTLPLLAQGVPAVLGAVALPHAIAADFERWKPTVFPTVPAVYRSLLDADVAPSAFASLRLAISAGAPLPSETAAAFARRFGRRIHAFYGSSETGGIAYDRTGAETLRGGVGRALRGVRIARAARERVVVASAAVFTIGNRRRSGGHGAWMPPDRVRIGARGALTLLGRRGAIVKVAGRRVNLAEIVARLRRVRGVVDAWVGVNGGADAVLGAALATARPAAEIRAELRADTAPWKIPKRWAVLARFPLTPRGKTDTRALHAAVFR